MSKNMGHSAFVVIKASSITFSTLKRIQKKIAEIVQILTGQAAQMLL